MIVPLARRTDADTISQVPSGERPDFRTILDPQSQLAYHNWSSMPSDALRCSININHLASCFDLKISFTEKRC